MEGRGKRTPRPSGAKDDTAPVKADAAEAAAAEPVAAEPAPHEAHEAAVPQEAAMEAPAAAETVGGDGLAALAAMQAALARGLEALGSEMAGLAQSELDSAARAASGLLGARTLADAIEINAGFASQSFETLLAGSARLSELGVKLAAETAQPILAQFGKSWMKPAHFGG